MEGSYYKCRAGVRLSDGGGSASGRVTSGSRAPASITSAPVAIHPQAPHAPDSPPADAMLLHNVAVASAARGTGLGHRLLEYAEQAARASGYRVIRLYTNETMTENIARYTRIGYVETHREPDGMKRVFMSNPLTA